MPVTKPSWRGSLGLISPEWHWAHKGLTVALSPTIKGDEHDLARRQTIWQGGAGGVTLVSSVFGSAWTSTTGCNTTNTASTDAAPGVTDCTVLLVGEFFGGNGTQNILIRRSGTVGTRSFYVIHDDAGTFTFGTNVPSASSAVSGVVTNGPHVIVISSSPSGCRFYVDGVLLTSASAVSGNPNTSPWIFGKRASADVNDPFDGRLALGAVWDYGMSEAQVKVLSSDPFGPFQPRLWGPELATGLSASLYATADGTITDVVSESDTTVNLWQSIDDDPATPNDADWINNTDAAGSAFFDLTDLPSGFGTADTAEMVARYRGQNFGTGTVTLFAQLFQSDETTSLSNEVQVAQVTATGAFADTTAVSFTGLNTTATKTVWDAAKVRFRWATT